MFHGKYMLWGETGVHEFQAAGLENEKLGSTTCRDVLLWARNFGCLHAERLILIYLLTLHISTVWRIESEEQMVFLGGHPAKY